MDLSEYLPMFLAEAREHLQELNLALVRIEEDPGDTATVDEIFRGAHSLKGASATMGFNRIAALTHEMENMFELLRVNATGLPDGGVDTLLECLDALTVALDAIDTDGEERIDHEPLVHRLKELVGTPASAKPEPEPAAAPAAAPASDVTFEVDSAVVHVVVGLDPGTMMPSVRAYQVIAALVEHGRIVRSIPEEAELEGFESHTVEVWVETDNEAHHLQAAVEGLPEVAVVTTSEVATARAPEPVAESEPAGPAAAPAPTAAPAAAAAAPEAGEREAAHAKKNGSSTVRVDAERLDQLMHLMGELVVHRTHVESIAAESRIPDLAEAVQSLTRSSQALQAMVMQVRMVPVEAVFLRFPRLVRDLSSKLGKKVELVLSGKETELDRTVVDALGDPIVHLVRNALDHGLEPSEERVAAGKPPVATVEISARHAGGKVVISVIDDGRGIDARAVARKAAERGLIAADAVESIDTRAAIELLFTPGFSTADTTSDVSGRGVGMDAVRTTIRELGGEVFLTSEPGAGTTAQIRLPLTLAIMSTLLVDVAGMPFAIPLDRVERTLRLADSVTRSVVGQKMLIERETVIPLLDAAAALGCTPGGEATHAVLVRGADQRIALAVSELVGQRELVTRPLPPEVGERACVSGGAVLSNGSIALIVDCDALAEAVRRRDNLPNAA